MKTTYTLLIYIALLLGFAACQDGNDFGDGYSARLTPGSSSGSSSTSDTYDIDNIKTELKETTNQLICSIKYDTYAVIWEANFQNDACIKCIAKVVFPNADAAKTEYNQIIIVAKESASLYQLNNNVITFNATSEYKGQTKAQVKQEFQEMMKEVEEHYITPSTNTLTFEATASSTTIDIDANVSYSVNFSETWITVTKSSDGTKLTVSVEQNTSAESRTATITMKETSSATTRGGITRAGLAEATITVTQAGTEPFINTVGTLTFEAAASSTTIDVNANVSYTVSFSETWITTTKSSDGTKLTISVDRNTSSESRTATITLEEASSATTRGGITRAGSAEATITVTQAGAILTWHSLGKGIYIDNWFEFEGEIDIQMCEQDPLSYRISAPYANYDGNDYYDMSGEKDDYLYLNILKAGDTFNGVTVTTNGLVTFPVYSTGAIHPSYTDGVIVMTHPSKLSNMAADETKWVCNKVVSWAEDGTPVQIQLAPFYFIGKIGGWNQTQNNDVIEIYFPGNVPDTRTFTVTGNGKTVTFKMKHVEAGTFQMGKDAGGYDITPVHSVTLTKDYYIGETEVTQALWYAVMGQSPTSDSNKWSSSYGLGDKYPAYFISYEDCQQFLTKLNQLTGRQFRFPTEAEWEVAAKGSTKSNNYTYSGSSTIGDVAWYEDNSGSKTHEVAGKQPNELGLYDMCGNVLEWCSDWYGSYSASAQTDPTGPATGSYRVNRGGSWGSTAAYCRCAYRFGSSPSGRDNSLGFRLAL